MLTRACTGCGETKPLEMFSPHLRGKYGRQSRCKKCCVAANRRRYFADHDAQREKSRLAALKYTAMHPEKRRAQRAKWAAANPEKMAACREAWRAANAERVRLNRLVWHAAHRAEAREAAREYRKTKGIAAGSCSADRLAGRIAMFGGRCWIPGCGKPFQEIDHVVPLSRGGTNWPANLRPICKTHNRVKHAKSWRSIVAPATAAATL